MIAHENKKYEVAKDFLELTIKLAKQGIDAEFQYRPNYVSWFFIWNKTSAHCVGKIHSNEDWNIAYERVSERIKQVVKEIENGK